MLGNGDCASAPECNNQPDCGAGLSSLKPPCFLPSEGAREGLSCAPCSQVLTSHSPPTHSPRHPEFAPGCSVLLPPAELATNHGVPPGAFVADIKCTADTAMYLAPHCSAAQSKQGALVTKKCLVGPLPANGSASIDPVTGERVPLVTDDDCVATGYFTKHNRTVALKSAVFLTADGVPCDVEALGNANAEPCYLEVGLVHFMPQKACNQLLF